MVVLRDDASGRWLRFQNPVEILSADRAGDVIPYNEAGEAAESTIANLAVEIDGGRFPAVLDPPR